MVDDGAGEVFLGAPRGLDEVLLLVAGGAAEVPVRVAAAPGVVCVLACVGQRGQIGAQGRRRELVAGVEGGARLAREVRQGDVALDFGDEGRRWIVCVLVL